MEEQLREWPEMAITMPQQPCLLCEADFGDRSALLQHIDQKHGGLQRYRNAMLVLESLCPHVVFGSEVRQYVRNYATFLREARMDWDGAGGRLPSLPPGLLLLCPILLERRNSGKFSSQESNVLC